MLHRALQSFRQSCIHSCLCQHFRIQSSLWRRFGRGFIGLSAWHGVGRRQLAAVAVRYKHAAVHTEGSGHIVRGPVICLLAHRFVWCISWCVCVWCANLRFWLRLSLFAAPRFRISSLLAWSMCHRSRRLWCLLAATPPLRASCTNSLRKQLSPS